MNEVMNQVIDIVAKQKSTLSFAESCTGGLLSATLTKKSGISQIFLGSIVSYSNSMKIDCLGVPKQEIETHGAVSEEVALSMAKGIQQKSGSTWSVSVTGIAGPGGGSDEKPVGTVCFGLVGPKISNTYKEFFSGDRESVQNSSMNFVWNILMEHLANDLKD